MTVKAINKVELQTPMSFADIEQFVEMGRKQGITGTTPIHVAVTETTGGDFRETWPVTVVTLTAQ